MVTAQSQRFAPLATASFFLSLHLGLIAYVGSSFIAQIFSVSYVGIVYACAAACTLVTVFLLPRAIRRYGIHATTGALSILLFFVLVGLAEFSTRPLLLSLFIASYALGVIMKLLLDLYVEHISDDSHTGRIRGLYLTIGNAAWLCAPFIAGVLVERSFAQVYAIAAVVLVPALLIILYRLSRLHEFTIRDTSLGDTFATLWHARRGTHVHVTRALTLDFVLNLFYAVMVIYLPLLLHDEIGMTWTTIGLLFTIMLTPFVILQYPLGRLADTRLGEKEVMIGALVLMAATSFAVSFAREAPIFVWALILFVSRVGAASLEVMKESYLFKHIDEHDALIVSISRNAMPFSYLVAPLLATIVLSFGSISTLFAVLGIMLLCALIPATHLRDTR